MNHHGLRSNRNEVERELLSLVNAQWGLSFDSVSVSSLRPFNTYSESNIGALGITIVVYCRKLESVVAGANFFIVSP